LFRLSRGAALDVVVLQDPVESMRPDQIALVVDPIPVMLFALVQGPVSTKVNDCLPWYILWNISCPSRKM
jgi:hypothetical protein